MRVLFIISGGKIANGAVLYAVDTAARWSAAGLEVAVLAPESSSGHRIAVQRGLTVWESPLSRRVGELRRVAKQVRDQRIDVVFTHCSGASAFGALLKLCFGIPSVATAHANKLQLHWCINDHVIAVSGPTRRFHITHNLVLPGRITTIHNAIDHDRFRFTPDDRIAARAELGVGPDDLLLGTVGRITRQKGQIDVVAALPDIIGGLPPSRRAGVRYLCVGAIDEAYCQRMLDLAVELGVRDRLLIGTHRAEVRTVYAALDIGLCPSIDEPFGLTAAETMTAGVPLIACRVGGLSETVRDGVTGRLVPPARPAAIAAAVIAAVTQPEATDAMAAAARSDVQSRLTLARHDGQVLDVLRRVARVGSV